MRFYTIAPEYTDFLQKIDARVPNHAGLGYVQKRPYIGVVLTVDGHDFLAPMSSPKPWHDQVKTSDKRFFKVRHSQHAQQSLGVISLCYMLPVVPQSCTMIDFGMCNLKYVDLLQAQFDFIKPNKDNITEKANKLFDAVVNKKQSYLTSKCCNFQNLIDVCLDYQSQLLPK
jgi:protein AbiQ